MSRAALLGRGALLLVLSGAACAPGTAAAEGKGSGTITAAAVGTGGSCGIAVRLYGFGTAQRGTVVVSRIAPTGRGVVAKQRAQLSDDAAGGRADADQVFAFTAAGMGLTGQAPSTRGWHLRVVVHPDGGPAATRNVWMACSAPAKRVATQVAAAPQQPAAAAVRPRSARPAAAPPAVQRRQLAAAPVRQAPVVATRPSAAKLYRIPVEGPVRPVTPQPVRQDSAWLEAKLLLSVLAATVIAGRLGAWIGTGRPERWQLTP